MRYVSHPPNIYLAYWTDPMAVLRANLALSG
jgi:hypothetical protein